MHAFSRTKISLVLMLLVVLVAGGTRLIHVRSTAYANSPAIALQLPWPTGQQHNINGGYTYGCGDHVNSNGVPDYYAIDFNLSLNQPVSAVAAGVAHIGSNPNGYGNYIWISHPGSFVSLYGHLSSFAITDGESVSQGQVIGYSGYSGHVIPPSPASAHLHFSLRSNATNQWNGTAYKPEPMSGYTGFGNYGINLPNCNANNPSPMYTSTPPIQTPPSSSPLGSRPSAIEKSNGDVNVFYPAADTHRTLHMAYWSSSNGWHDKNTGQWTQASPSAVEATISSQANVAGTGRVYYTDAGDGNLHELSWNPASGSWSVYNTGRRANGSPSAVVDLHGVVHVYYSDRGTSPASLEEYYLDSSGWHSNDFGHQYQVVGDPYAIVKQNGDVNVFYHNAGDNNLHMAYLNSSGGSWADYNSGQAITNNPTAVEAPISTATNGTGTVRVYYSGNDIHYSMNELSWNPASGLWSVYNTGRWMQNSASAILDRSGVVRVYYNDSGSNPNVLQEYRLDSTGRQVSTGPCSVCGNRWLAGTPSAIVKQNGDVNVFYRDSGDSLLHMSYMPAGGNWNDVGFYPMAP